MTSDFLTEAFLTLRGRWKSEDALQDAFCRLWGRKYKVGSVREAVGLLSRTGRNLEIDEFRKAERLPRQVSIDGRQIEDEGSDAAEREALEPTYSRNIIKLQIINNQALFGVHSKSKSF